MIIGIILFFTLTITDIKMFDASIVNLVTIILQLICLEVAIEGFVFLKILGIL